ncbi:MULTISPECIES: response regulator [unclassified Brevibacterium]|uniref:response regulator n=1 Tax=unclassified Brevibacterium TaxID=2614124 RepID=UPI000C6314B1|nr:MULTISPECIES: response regulator transcription factor [unclassified Brevibacterium]SMY04718.1 two component transcriptional regulator, LuxR family [Brevibacterium sp. 239c]
MERPGTPITVAVVDDDPYVRSALTAVLSATDGLSLVGCFSDGLEVVEFGPRDVDVVLMDIRMPQMNGIRATEELKRHTESPAVIMLTTFHLDEEVTEALRVGATGYLMKDTAPTELVEAIRKVARGQTILSSSVTRQLIDLVRFNADRRQVARQRLETLTPRELEVAVAISTGQANSEISRELYISVPTVKAQVSSIFTKLGVTSRLQIALIVRDAQATQ